MIDRRTFIGALGSSLAVPPLLWGEAAKPRRLAMVTTEWRYPSHAWHMGERFLVGYPVEGRWHRSPLKLVSTYMDQFPKNDLSRARSQEFGFPLYPTIAEALRCGGDKLDVDGVLLVGEHGKYPVNELGQTLYPRYEFFKEIVEVFKQDGRTVPVFNDKHLSWKWDWSKEMVDTAHAMGFPLLAGSSVAGYLEDAVDRPALRIRDRLKSCAWPSEGWTATISTPWRTIQCMVERRRGGETGVDWLQAMRGEPVWEAMGKGSFDGGGWDPQLFSACLCRSLTLAQAETMNHRYPTREQIQQWVKEPVVYRFQYADGLKATMMLMNGLVDDFTFAARLKGRPRAPLHAVLSSAHPQRGLHRGPDAKVEEMILTGKAPYPAEAHPADLRPGDSRSSVPGPGRKKAGDAPPGSPLPGPPGIALPEELRRARGGFLADRD